MQSLTEYEIKKKLADEYKNLEKNENLLRNEMERNEDLTDRDKQCLLEQIELYKSKQFEVVCICMILFNGSFTTSLGEILDYIYKVQKFDA